MRNTKILTAIALTLCLGWPALARVEDYGHRRYEHGWHDRGPGWAGAIAGGILGAAAGFALSRGGPPPVVYAPPAIGTIMPGLPPGCVAVPAYNGAPLYNCGNVYYQPVYEGGNYMYEVVPVP